MPPALALIAAELRRGLAVAFAEADQRQFAAGGPPPVINVKPILDLPAPGTSPVGRLVALGAALFAGVGGHFGLLFATLLAMLQPAPPLAAAAGVACLAAAVLTWRDHQILRGESYSMLAIAFLLYGVTLVWIACANRREKSACGDSGAPGAAAAPGWGAGTQASKKDRPNVTTLTACLGIGAMLAWGAVLVSGTSPVRLHQGAFEWPGATVLTLALAAALALSSRRALRSLAVVVAAAGLAVGFVGSTAFLDRFGRDRFLATAQPFAFTTVSGPSFADFSVPLSPTDLRISPSGRHVALVIEGEDEHEEQMRFHIGRPGGALADVDAQDAEFVNDDRLLLLDQTRDGAIVWEIDADRPDRVIWRKEIADLYGSSLSLDAVTNTWRALGWNRRGEIVRAEGHVGSPSVVEQRWPVPPGNRRGSIITTSGREALVVEIRYDRGWLDASWTPSWLYLFGWMPRSESTVWMVGTGGRTELATSRLEINCPATTVEGDRAMCTAFDGNRTRVAAIDLPARRLAALGSLQGRFFAYGGSDRRWMNGWVHGQAIALRLDTREAITLDRQSGGAPTRVVGAGRILGGIWRHDSTSTVRLYRIVEERLEAGGLASSL